MSGQQPMQELDVDSPLLQSSDTALGRQAVSMETEPAVPSGLGMDTQNRQVQSHVLTFEQVLYMQLFITGKQRERR